MQLFEGDAGASEDGEVVGRDVDPETDPFTESERDAEESGGRIEVEGGIIGAEERLVNERDVAGANPCPFPMTMPPGEGQGDARRTAGVFGVGALFAGDPKGLPAE